MLIAATQIIAELAERSPIVIKNCRNPSRRKNLDVRPYMVPLLTCVVNCNVGTPTSRLCSVVQWSVHWAPSRTTRVLVLAGARRCALETCGKKKMRALPLGLAKTICYFKIVACTLNFCFCFVLFCFFPTTFPITTEYGYCVSPVAHI